MPPKRMRVKKTNLRPSHGRGSGDTRRPAIPSEERKRMWLLLERARVINAAFLVSFISNIHLRVSLTDVRVLLHLAQHPNERVGHLAKGITASLAWISRVSFELERAGLVERIRDEKDQRVVHLQLTKKGGTVVRLIGRHFRTPISNALAEVPIRKRKLIAGFLRQLAQHV